MVLTCFPGGWTRISMPHSSGADLSSRMSEALGAMKGTIHAGAAGNESCFVAALNMMPMQIRIGDCIARSADGPMTKGATEPMIAYTANGNIYMEPITNEVINDIRI